MPRWLGTWLRRAAEGGKLPSWLVGFAALGMGLLLLLGFEVVGIVSTMRVPLVDSWFRGLAPASRLFVSNALTLGTLGVAIGAIWWFLRRLPIRLLRIDDEFIVAWVAEGPDSIQRGDWVACRLPVVLVAGQRGPCVAVEQVLAVPGDRVRYSPSTVQVNGRRQRRVASMPGAGEVLVPEGHWLIWPVFGRSALRPEGMPDSVAQRCGLVSHDRFIGRVTRPWLARRRLSWLQAVEDLRGPDE